ncbi:MAG: hypothetical protein JWM04_2382, partial [Verrucomicrobiales bacterium]|nr:hypothetical protein [Verrucomicrobiales bacterium]
MAAFQLNWFDLLVLGFLVFGLIRGRKRGMSEEILSVTQTLLMVFLGAQFYQPLGEKIAQTSVLGAYSSYLVVYIG